VFSTVESGGVTWFQIAQGECVNSLKARAISIRPHPPEGVDTGRWIEIDLLQQILTVYEDGKLLFATLIASGLEPFYTQPGLFQIYVKKPLETMQAAYWRTFFGYPQSHGCVNLSPGDAQWLFQWANEGDYVWVHDPSGRTPIDEDYYGPGVP